MNKTARDLVKQRQTQEAQPEQAAQVPTVPPEETDAPEGEGTTSIVGRLALFNCQTGIYSTHDDGAEIAQGSEYIAHGDLTIHGWIRFDPDGGPVTSVTGLYFDPAWKLPPRPSLGEMDNLRGGSG